MTSYSPFRSTVTDETLVKFLRNDLQYDLETVPGIGPKAKEILNQHNVGNGFQLFAKFLNFKTTEGDDCINHCTQFYDFLTNIGIKANRHSITKSIGEKAAITFPSLYIESQFNHLEPMQSEA